jgi:hypothetical protein
MSNAFWRFYSPESSDSMHRVTTLEGSSQRIPLDKTTGIGRALERKLRGCDILLAGSRKGRASLVLGLWRRPPLCLTTTSLHLSTLMTSGSLRERGSGQGKCCKVRRGCAFCSLPCLYVRRILPLWLAQLFNFEGEAFFFFGMGMVGSTFLL